MKILECVDVQIAKLGDTLGITERMEQFQFGPVLPPGSVFNDAAIVAVLIDLAVVSQEPIYRARKSPVRRSRACLVFCGVVNPAPLMMRSDQRG
jgi:hypothetical protein